MIGTDEEPEYGKAEWWKRHYPGFDDKQCFILELCTWTDLGYKEIKRLMRKQEKRCSKSNGNRS